MLVVLDDDTFDDVILLILLRRFLPRILLQRLDRDAGVLGEVVVRRDDFFWDDEDVRRRLRVDVAEGQAVVVFVDDLGRNLALDDFQEEVVTQHGSPPGRLQVGAALLG